MSDRHCKRGEQVERPQATVPPSEDWLGRWREGRTGWHEPRGNAALRRHWPALAAGSRVLVPLCGKAVDLLWLAGRGLDVTGVELSQLAVEAFFAENGLTAERVPGEELPAWRARDAAITLYCGDYFDFDAPPFDALYDRGALVALPPAERPRYAAHTARLLQPRAFRLVVTLEYDQRRAAGPPFAVAGSELETYWPDLERVESRDDLANAPPKFRDAGLERFDEVVWRSPRSA